MIEKRLSTVEDIKYLAFEHDIKDPRALFSTVVDPARWQAQPIGWKSPYTVTLKHGQGVHSHTPRILPYLEGQPELIMIALARAGFGEMTLGWCMRLLKYLHLRAIKNELYFVLWELIKYYLPNLSDEDILNILLRRMTQVVSRHKL